jgi:pseudo-rSAM protein
MEKKYWLTLSSSVFIWKKGRSCYLYDSTSYNGKLFPVLDDKLESLIDKLLNVDNLYCIDIFHADMVSEALKSFLNDIISLGMGQLIEQNGTEKRRPIQFPPILNLQSDVDRLRSGKLSDLTIGEHVLTNLHEVYITFSEPVSGEYMDRLNHFIDSLTGYLVNSIFISGFYPELYEYEKFWTQLEIPNITITFILPLEENTKRLIPFFTNLNLSNIRLKILVSSGNKNDSALIKEIIGELSIPIEWNFLVSNESDCEIAGNIVENLELDNYNIKPFLDGKNITFFEEYVFMGENDIQNSKLSKRSIFAHQALNTNDFGKLTISPEGKVYANTHFESLGTIDDDIRLLIYKEMNGGTSWRRIRDTKPCDNCVYQWLCPSPSNYELTIGKPNLCHVKP